MPSTGASSLAVTKHPVMSREGIVFLCQTPHLEIFRTTEGAIALGPAAVLLPTAHGDVTLHVELWLVRHRQQLLRRYAMQAVTTRLTTWTLSTGCS